jgi:serine/threonine-protein kinase OSR1/STK39
LQKTLLSNAPSIEERAKKVRTSRRTQGASGRLHRTEAGDWVWSSDEEESQEKEVTGNGSDAHVSNNISDASQHNHIADNKSNQSPNNQSPGSPINNEPQNVSNPINLVLRIRNAKKELNDIRFEFTIDKGLHFFHFFSIQYSLFGLFFLSIPDTAEGIAQELISAGLVDSKDFVVVAANLQKLIIDRSTTKSVVFALVSYHLNNSLNYFFNRFLN